MKVRWLVAVLIIGLFGTAYAQKTHKPLKLPSGKKGMEIKAEGGAAVGYYFWEDGTDGSFWLDESDPSLWTGSILTGEDDDTAMVKASNNYVFTYFGRSYNLRKSWIYVNSNGFITIASDPGDPNNSYTADMPNEDAPNNTIAPFWTDLELKDAGGTNTAVQYADDSPSKMVFYYPVRHVNDASKVYYFQVWLLGSNTVVFSYKSGSSDFAWPSNKELGVENSDGSMSVEIDPNNIDNALNTNTYYWVKFYYKDTYTQSFEATSIPSSWSTGSGSGSWSFGVSDHARLGNASAKFNSSTFTGNGAPLVTPRLDLKYAGSPYLIFYLYHTKVNPSSPDSLYIDVSYDGGLTWSEIAGYSRYAYYEGWEKVRVNLDAYKGYANVKVRFRPVAKSGDDIYIDAVKIYTDYTTDIDVTHKYYPEDYLLPISSGDLPDTVHFTVKNWADALTANVEVAYHDASGWHSSASAASFAAGEEKEFSNELFLATPNGLDSIRVVVAAANDQDRLGDTIQWAVDTSSWSKWDDGSAEGYTDNGRIAVEFKNPYSATNIDSIGILIADVSSKAVFDTVYVITDNGGEPTGTILWDSANVQVDQSGWLWIPIDEPINDNQHHLWVVAKQTGNNIKVAVDKSNPSGMSAYYDESGGSWVRVNNGDYMVRMHIVKKPEYDATVAEVWLDHYVDSHVKGGYNGDYTITPRIMVKNVGSSTLYDVRVNLQVSDDGGNNWTNVTTEEINTSLGAGDYTYYTFSTGYDASGDGDGTEYLVKVSIDGVDKDNTGTFVSDDNPNNDVLTAQDTVVKDTVHAGSDNASGWKWEDNIGDVFADITVVDAFWNYVTSGEADDTLALGDYGTVKVGLPFLVNFFGINYDSVYIGANGALDFVSSDIPNDNVDLSTYSASGKALVAPFWDDLVTKASVFDPPDQLIYVKSSANGSLPDTFAVTWYNVILASTNEALTFQVLIIDNQSGSTEGYTDIIFRYGSGFSYDADSADPTIGLYNNVGSGTYYAQYSYDENPVGLSGNLWLTAPAAIYWKNPTPTEVGEGDRNGLPKTFALAPVKPNPVSGMANISFALPKDARVRIEVYDATGRVVETIANDRFNAGYHTVAWNASHTTNGVYFIRMKADGFNQTRRVIVMK